MSPQFKSKSGIASAILHCAIFVSGCASWQGPRIDPSGESLLIWPNQAPPVVAGPAGATIVSPPPAIVAPPVVAPPVAAPPIVAPPIVAPPIGNVQAPPVYPDVPAAPLAPPVITVPPPSLPAGPTATTVPYGAVPVVPAPVIPATPIPALPGVSPGVATPLGAAVPVGQDYVRITPDRVLAPVGSEVVLKAGICGADGYLVANQRIEWLLSSGCVGQFVDLGEREQFHVLRAIWDMPRKVDSTYAIGSTSNAPICLYRGTPDPTDDVQILRGDAWITLTSAAEGVSHVTAYTPAIADWNLRRAIATIYWVDVQWVLPPSTVVPAGRPHVLTTTVMRRTDGAPLAGWLVRYEAAGGASFGYEGGSVVEVPTDESGRASVEVSPADMSGGSTTVNITIVRPPQATTDASPRLEIGRGATTISWAAGAIGEPTSPPEARPAPIERAPPSSTPVTPYEVTPRPALPSTASPPSGSYTPPADEPAPGRPQLDLTLRRTTAENVAVGDFASFDIVVTNRGDGTARGIRIRSQFDRGLSHPNAKPNEFAVDYPGMRDLPPGDSETIPLTFQVVANGTLCHEVTVSADGAEAVSARGCVTARQSTLELDVRGHERRNVGETAEFVAVLRNVGDVAATNIELVARCDEPLEPQRAEPGHARLSDGALVMRIAKMEANERREFRMEALCRSAANSACNRVTVTADGGVTVADDACVEILPPAASGRPGAVSPPIASNLRLTITESTNPARVGEREIIYVNVQNVGQQVERQVSVRVLLPPEFNADATQIQPQGEATVLGQEIRFSAIPELQPQAERQYNPDECQPRGASADTGRIGGTQPAGAPGRGIQSNRNPSTVASLYGSSRSGAAIRRARVSDPRLCKGLLPRTQCRSKVSKSMPRFVLLYHECPPGYDRPSHWDLMLDAGGSLRTWALLQLPRGWEAAQWHTASIYPACVDVSPQSSVNAEPLGDHRRDYLEYEGLLSGERGHVTRVDAGSFETISESRQHWHIELRGERLSGQVTLAADKPNANGWTLTLNGPN